MAKGRGRFVRGDTAPATAEGFAKLLESADEAFEKGFALHGVVNLTTIVNGKRALALGAVFVRMPQPPKTSNLID